MYVTGAIHCNFTYLVRFHSKVRYGNDAVEVCWSGLLTASRAFLKDIRRELKFALVSRLQRNIYQDPAHMFLSFRGVLEHSVHCFIQKGGWRKLLWKRNKGVYL